jgi:hypothetical protein
MNASETFYISPIIRGTLSLFYIALLLPLPFLAHKTGGASPLWMSAGISIGMIALQGALSQRVTVDEATIRVEYPGWFPAFLVKSWSVPWTEITALKMRSTGQGGIVYYLLTKSHEGYLLPMRIAGFNRLVTVLQEKTAIAKGASGAIETQDIRPLAQPWMYFFLLIVTGLLLLIDVWSIWMATNIEILR